jgi:hypothetical protein
MYTGIFNKQQSVALFCKREIVSNYSVPVINNSSSGKYISVASYEDKYILNNCINIYITRNLRNNSWQP